MKVNSFMILIMGMDSSQLGPILYCFSYFGKLTEIELFFEFFINMYQFVFSHDLFINFFVELLVKLYMFYL